MASESRNVVVLLKSGKADNGKNATLAFSCALAALAMGHNASVFLTSDGAVWGYQGSSTGISVQGFLPLEELIDQFVESGGRIILCSVCHKTCSAGSPEEAPSSRTLKQTEIGGFARILDLAVDGVTITF